MLHYVDKQTLQVVNCKNARYSSCIVLSNSKVSSSYVVVSVTKSVSIVEMQALNLSYFL